MKEEKCCMITDITQQNTLKFAYDLKRELDIWMTYSDSFREIEKAMDISVGAISSYPILNEYYRNIPTDSILP